MEGEVRELVEGREKGIVRQGGGENKCVGYLGSGREVEARRS